MARTAVLGFPRIGADRELKAALEDHWAGRASAAALEATAREVRAANLRAGREAGIDVLPAGDFALYDHVLDTAELVSLVAERHRGDRFLACRGGDGITPLEMTKWFDTNYHYLVPELASDQAFELNADKWLAHLREAGELGVDARPVVLGPLSLLLLSKGLEQPLALLPALTAVYAELLAALAAAGAREVQIDEPCLVLDRSDAELDAFAGAFEVLCAAAPVCLATYFEALDERALARIARLPLAELHVDLVRAPSQLDAVLDALPTGARLSAGVIDGRNVWAADLDVALDRLDRAAARIGSERLTVAPSCSLLHVPYSVAREQRIRARGPRLARVRAREARRARPARPRGRREPRRARRAPGRRAPPDLGAAHLAADQRRRRAQPGGGAA